MWNVRAWPDSELWKFATNDATPKEGKNVTRSEGFKKLARIYRHLAITMAVKIEEAIDKTKDPMLVKRTYATKWKAHQRDFDKQAARYLKANN